MNRDPAVLAETMEAWAHEAGDMARQHFRRTGALTFKQGQEAVTAADRLIETHLRGRIAAAFPGDVVVGEEFGGPTAAEVPAGTGTWHIDPIDGTLNFALGLPDFCTSLALVEGEAVLAACVHQPLVGDTYTAVRGGGARLNGAPMAVSVREPLAEAVLSAQFKKDGALVSQPALLQALLRRPLKVRKMGAIALELAWVAAGFLDGLVAGFRHPIQLYDVAAGLLLVDEAGGRVTDFAGAPYLSGGSRLLATNGRIHGELAELLAGDAPSPDETPRESGCA